MVTCNKPGKHSWLCAIIAGGQSQRMGQDKAELTFTDARGESINVLERALIDALHLFGQEQVRVVGRYSPLDDVTLLHDYCDQPYQGPLSALAAALLEAKQLRCDYVLTLPCDSLLRASDCLPALISAMDKQNAQAWVLTDQGRELPMMGVYRADLADQLTEYLDQGHRRLMRFLATIRVETVPLEALPLYQAGFTEIAKIASYNTPKEFEQAKLAFIKHQACYRHGDQNEERT